MSSLLDRFESTRTYSEQLCKPLSVEDHIPQAIAFVSPPKWHLAHTSWFFEEMILRPFLPDYRVFVKDYCFLFNSYYNTVGDRLARPERGLLSRPSVEEVYNYRQHVTRAMRDILANSPDPRVLELTELGINHEQQHQELLLTDLKYTFSRNPTHPRYENNIELCLVNGNPSELIPVSGGLTTIGHSGDGFCFDNEKGRHQVYLEEFSIASHLVTNGDYLQFIDDSGYQTHKLWLDDGWAWINTEGIKAPLYWVKKNNEWHHYTLSGLQPVNPNHILTHVSFYEAQAFATWKGLRLPTEFEWEAANSLFKWGDRWEWTYSAYLPYPKFEVASGAVGEYNGKFMINQMVLRGGSSATPKGHSRATYRNFFQPELRWQFNGIRLAK